MESTDHLLIKNLASMEQELRACCVVNLSVDGVYANVLKGCFVKCFEFVTFSLHLGPESHSYFLAPALRGICEDFITLRYLSDRKLPTERDELLRGKIFSIISDSIDKQKIFFQKRREFQPVLGIKPKAVLQKIGLPSVRDMATAVSLSDIYDFIYSITSDVVHFNPRIIIRNAWGKDPLTFDHSVTNFDLYYADFCQTYGVFFLTLFAQNFPSQMPFSCLFMDEVEKLKKWLDDKLRWPEAVTFEEMNLNDPGEIIRIALKAAYDAKGVSS